MPESYREKLADSQALYLKALMNKAPIPHGFDACRFAEAQTVLANKRRRALAKAWPGLLNSKENLDLFFQYARKHGAPRCGAYLDGRLFARYLERTGHSDKYMKMATYRFDILYRLDGMRLVKRSRFEQMFLKLRKYCGIERCFSR